METSIENWTQSPEGIRLPYSRQRAQNPRNRVGRAGRQRQPLPPAPCGRLSPPNWDASPKTSSSPPSGNPESHHPHPPSAPPRWTEPGCWPNGQAGCQGGCQARSQQGTRPRAPGVSPGTNGTWTTMVARECGPVGTGAQRPLPMSVVSWAPAGQVSVLYLGSAWILTSTHARYPF